MMLSWLCRRDIGNKVSRKIHLCGIGMQQTMQLMTSFIMRIIQLLYMQYLAALAREFLHKK